MYLLCNIVNNTLRRVTCIIFWFVFVHELYYKVLVFFQAEDGIRYLVRSRGLGDVYKRQDVRSQPVRIVATERLLRAFMRELHQVRKCLHSIPCLLYTSDAADERSSVDLGGRRIIKKKKQTTIGSSTINTTNDT